MGTMHYGSHRFEMDDRLLAHVQLIIGTKLRRGENFFMTWAAGPSAGAGRRNAVWIDNGVPIHMEYEGGHEPAINRAWAESLADSAARGGGLVIHAEDLVPSERPANGDRGTENARAS